MRPSQPSRFNLNQPRFAQISESHCGPAVTQMLLSHMGVEVSQEAVVEMGEATTSIVANGMSIDQFALAVTRLAPHLRLWYKENSTLKQLGTLVLNYNYPVGVEWQGVFGDGDSTDENGIPDEDNGHYSVVVDIDFLNRRIMLADPYGEFIKQARSFEFKEFEERWWDFNDITDSNTGKTHRKYDYQMMFLVTSVADVFPIDMGMKRNG